MLQPDQLNLWNCLICDVSNSTNRKAMKTTIPIAEAQPLLRHSGRDARRNALLRIAARRRIQQLVFLAATVILILVLYNLFAALSELDYNIKPVTPSIHLPKSVKQSWAQYTPYYSRSEYTDVPRHCRVTQVNIVSGILSLQAIACLAHAEPFSCSDTERDFPLPITRMKGKGSGLLFPL